MYHKKEKYCNKCSFELFGSFNKNTIHIDKIFDKMNKDVYKSTECKNCTMIGITKINNKLIEVTYSDGHTFLSYNEPISKYKGFIDKIRRKKIIKIIDKV